MLLIALILSVFNFFQVITISQAEVSLVFTDVDVTLNPKYFAADYEIFLLDEGIDNQIFINFTVIKIMPKSAKSYFKMLGATMGEYKINTGFDFECEICELPDEPIIFGRMWQKIGIDQCPCRLGHYGHEAFEVDLSTLPDEFLPNKYLLSLWFDINEDENLASIQLYFTVQ